MQTTTLEAALIVALALLVAALPTTATAQTSAAPLRQPEPTGLLGPDEAREVARALDEAQLDIGRTIHVDVVVDRDGRGVSTGWFSPVTPEGAGYATEVPMPVLAEDVNAPDGIVIPVDPFEGTASFVEAPGLSGPDERYLSGLMTDQFRRGSYDDGLVDAAHGLEHRLAPIRPLMPPPLPETPRRASGTERRVSEAAVTLFVGGLAAVILLLGLFLRGERHRGPQGPDKGVGFVVAGREAESCLSDLAPRVMLLAEKERSVIGGLRNLEEGAPDGPNRRRKAEGLLRQAVSGEFWKSFVAATSLTEKDPEGALPELRRLSTEVEAALGRLGEAELTLCDPRGDGGSCRGEECPTRREENDG